MSWTDLLLGLVTVVLVSGLAYQWHGARRDRRRWSPPGRLVRANGHRLHLWVQGDGAPTVVLEAGIGASSLSWTHVAAEAARSARVCTYDRAGLGWSDAGPRRRSGRRSVDELRQALREAALEPPYVLVGHSFGAYLVRLFAARYPHEVAGLVLVDPLDPEDWRDPAPTDRRRLVGGVLCARAATVLAAFGVVRFAVDRFLRGGRRVPRGVLRSFPPEATPVVEGLVKQIAKLPARDWPVVQAQWTRTRSFWMLAQYLAALPRCAREVVAAEEAMASAASAPARWRWEMPVVVLSAASASAATLARHRATAAAASSGRHEVAPGSGHWMQLDAPADVAAAIRRVTHAARPGHPRSVV